MSIRSNSTTWGQALAAAAALGLLGPATASAMTLPGLNMDGYCKQTYGSSAYATLTQNNAFGWTCRLNGSDYSMNLNAACQQQHTGGYSADYLNYSDPYSWYCTLRTTYSSMNGSSLTQYVWRGTKIALMTTDRACSTPSLMKIVDGVDLGYTFYRNATNRDPQTWTPTVYQGRNVMAGLPSGTLSACGTNFSACGYIGFTGVEFRDTTFNTLCNAANGDQYDQTPYYELGRNFWFYGDKLEYKGTDDTGSITTGYAVAMRFLAMDYAGVSAKGAPFGSTSFSTMRSAITGLVDTYRTNSSLTWSNTLKLGTAPSNSYGLKGTDFFASFVLRLHRVHGSNFINQLWQKAALRGNAATTQDAVDNFVIAASQAANANLYNLFSTTWKWPVSSTAQSYLQSTLGSPVSTTPYL
ncbi:MAG TPA: calcium-binding protein [Archangium sp.]|uniref:calcium-binding protein n=1 Tax=Archangium sp. TaxID=1872627 RepID=UPI002E304B47|nr:calcium-binding protein [Archangium sp.]HEX5752120.1 calcium-binding protein [Archangium sp.]